MSVRRTAPAPLTLEAAYARLADCDIDFDQVVVNGYILFVISGDYTHSLADPVDRGLDHRTTPFKIKSGRAAQPGGHVSDRAIDLKIYGAFAEHFGRHTLIDIGASYGQETLKYLTWCRANLGDRFLEDIDAIAFEPSVAASLARLNFDFHGLDVDLYANALGDRDEPVMFHVSTQHTTGGSVIKPAKTERRRVPVSGIRLDTFADWRQIDGPLFIKIDTQGFEPQVLSGATELLRRLPSCGVMEFSPLPMSLYDKPAHFLAELLERFDIAEVGLERDQCRRLRPQDVEAFVNELIARQRPWTDIVFFDRRFTPAFDPLAKLC